MYGQAKHFTTYSSCTIIDDTCQSRQIFPDPILPIGLAKGSPQSHRGHSPGLACLKQQGPWIILLSTFVLVQMGSQAHTTGSLSMCLSFLLGVWCANTEKIQHRGKHLSAKPWHQVRDEHLGIEVPSHTRIRHHPSLASLILRFISPLGDRGRHSSSLTLSNTLRSDYPRSCILYVSQDSTRQSWKKNVLS